MFLFISVLSSVSVYMEASLGGFVCLLTAGVHKDMESGVRVKKKKKRSRRESKAIKKKDPSKFPS